MEGTTLVGAIPCRVVPRLASGTERDRRLLDLLRPAADAERIVES